MKKLFMKKGFTLVELLIVIALLGALAIGLLAALDPIEMMRRGADTGARNSTKSMFDAFTRFYVAKGYMPWCSAPGSCSAVSGLQANAAGAASIAIANTISAGELKSTFFTTARKDLTRIYVSGAESTAIVCFLPQSKSLSTDANTLYNASGVPTTPATHWCLSQ
jgi:prepilin-type N-terminal cleavage/methylation domain-containing protein